MTEAQLTALATIIKDETAAEANTASRIGQMYIDMITSLRTINTNSLWGTGDLTISGSISDGDKTGVQVSSSGSIWT